MVFVESVNHIAMEANELNVKKTFVTFWEGLDQTKKEGGLVDEFYVSISRKNNEAKFQPIPYCEIVLAQRSTWGATEPVRKHFLTFTFFQSSDDTASQALLNFRN